MFVMLLILVLAAYTVRTLAVAVQAVRGASKRRLLAETRGTLCDAPDGIGISVLWSCRGSLARSADLLNVGYACYEAVVVIDAERYPEAFETLVAHYHLIRVNHTLDAELSVGGVRGLYRSRKRCFRRLVAVDKAFTTAAADFDAAAAVATYDYVMPLGPGCRLLPDAVERLAAELSGRPAGTTKLVQAAFGAPAVLLSREAVIEAGGFARHPWRRLPRQYRVTLYEALVAPELHRPRVHPALRRAGMLALAAAIGATAFAGWWTGCAVLLTVAVGWCGARLVASEGDGMHFIPARAGLRSGRLGLKNFIVW